MCFGVIRGPAWLKLRSLRFDSLRASQVSRDSELGTSSVQLRERKSGELVPKRHQIKHLDF